MITTGNTVLITGGSSGIGLSLAKRFLSLQNTVIITGRDTTRLQQVKNDHPGMVTFAGDLTEQSALDELRLFLEQHHPGLNTLVNNAAVQYNYSFVQEPDILAKTDYEIGTNLSAPLKLTGMLLPLLLQNKNSAIINVSSGLFIAPKQSAPVYCATKSAIHSYSKALRYQLENSGVKVFEIIPALVDTPMTAGRGKSKISPDQLTEEFFNDFSKDRFESYIGKTKLLKLIHRISPNLADRMMKNG